MMRELLRVACTCALVLGVTLGVSALVGHRPAHAGTSVRWEETFARPLDWGSPSRHDPSTIRRVYALAREDAGPFLRAVHDAARRPGHAPPPAVHYGHAFPDGTMPLAKTCYFEWQWRVLEHPAASKDPWEDVAASIYVVTRAPGLFSGGRGFKLGWLSRPGPAGTKQRGIVQVEVRHDAASPEWKTDRIDLCALYRQSFGAIDEDESIRYIGVVTDADGSRSTARADYAGFKLY